MMDKLLKLAGMPPPPQLVRENGAPKARPLEGRVAIVGQAPGAASPGALREALKSLAAEARESSAEGARIAAFDATGCATPESLRELYQFFHPLRLAPNARVVVLAAAEPADPAAAATARAVEGFVRAHAKELGRRGGTANLLYVPRGAADRLAAPIRFFASDRSAYVSGQALRISTAVPPAPARDRSALVTGAARGLGAATARRLEDEGVRVVRVDMKDAPLAIDITAPDAPGRLAAEGPFDIVVHNAGIIRDRTLGRMSAQEWDAVLAVNLQAILRIDRELLGRGLVREGGRMVYLSSVNGIGGAAGQTNYSATKAALLGYVQAQAPLLAPRGITANAVAPGFIETAMTKDLPFLMREFGKRLNSLGQMGIPEDVAEGIAFLAAPDAHGINGQTLRVCGQAMIGA